LSKSGHMCPFFNKENCSCVRLYGRQEKLASNCAVRHCAVIVERPLPLNSFILAFAFEMWYCKQFQLFLILWEPALNENDFEIVYVLK
jgi:hypothetical protein